MKTFRAALQMVVLLALSCSGAQGADPHYPRFRAVVFDYFVLFDPNSVVAEAEKAFPGKGAQFVEAWRSKQFEYCFLRSITSDPKDFFAITGDALDYTVAQLHLSMSPVIRGQILNAYLNLKPWPDTVKALKQLRASGVRIITISNFSPMMLRTNAEHAGITSLFDELLSTEASYTFKPDPRAYALGVQYLRLPKKEIAFAAFGGWDAYGAKHFGYATVWVNRSNFPSEKLGQPPDKVSVDLAGLIEFVLGAGH